VARLGEITGPSGLDSDTGPAAGATRRRAGWWGLALVAGWLVQAGLRAWLSRAQTVPLALPDESAYLIAARVLTGGAPANFSYSTMYPGGYPLLIAPVYWFTHDPATVYRAVLLGINAPVSALIMPLGYVACRRLGLARPEAFGVAMAGGLLPAALFYSQYALTDAIYPVLVLAWLLAVHSWLTAPSARGRYLAAAGSGLLTGYAYAVHSRGAVMVAGFVLAGAFAWWRRLVPRGTAAAAAVALVVPLGAAELVNRHLTAVLYPSGPRTLTGEALIRLHTVRGVVLVLEFAIGQMWRFVLDSWGVAGLGLAAAVVLTVRPAARVELRVMAALAAGVTVVTAVAAPAALPPTQAQTWASGRYLDGLVEAFFLAGAVVLLRAAPRRLAIGAACVAAATVLAAIVVSAYAGASVPTSGFGAGFVFGEVAVLAQSWSQASVLLATAVGLALLAAAAGLAGWAGQLGAAGAGRARTALVAGLGVVSLVASAQMTDRISQASTPAQERNASAIVAATGLAPGQRLAIGTGLSWTTWMPQAYEVWWAPLEFFDATSQPPPAGASVVEVAWPAGRSAASSWPQAPAGWTIALEDQADGWVAWRHTGG
jgi:hypothetical protein